MNAHEPVKSATALLRIIAVLVCAAFLLDSVGHFAHLHVATAASKATTDFHGIKCGFCTTFGGLAGAPSYSKNPPPALAVMTLAPLPDAPAAVRRSWLIAQPRGPPISQSELELRFT